MPQGLLEIHVVEKLLLLAAGLDPAIVDHRLLGDEDGLALEEGAECLGVRRLAATQQIERENGCAPAGIGKDIAPRVMRVVAPL
jgi:hypothetical protein